MYIKISGRARTGGKYSAPTIIQTSRYFDDFDTIEEYQVAKSNMIF